MRSPNLALLAATCAAAVLAVVGVAMADTTTSTTSPSPSPDSTAAGDPASDARGYPGTGAYCDGALAAVARGHTVRALVAICADDAGQLQYRGARRSDLASLTMPAGRTADGAIVATNDGVTYAVSPTMLLVSEGDTVLYRDDWIAFEESDAAAESTTGASPTVSTTTVTLPPEG